MTCGVYQIVNTATGQRYIGRAVNMRRRIGKHLTELRGRYHPNAHLQRSFEKYGEQAFRAAPVIICRPQDVAMYEHLLIMGYRSDDHAVGFNMTVATDDGILTHTPEARERIAHYNRTKKLKYERTPEIRARIGASLKGRPGANKGRVIPDDQRAKMSKAKKENWADPEKRSALEASRKNRSPEERAKTSKSITALWKDPDFRSKMSQPKSDEHRSRVSNSLKEKWKDPVYRAMMLETRRVAREKRMQK